MRGRTLFLLGIAGGLCAIPMTCQRSSRCYSRDLVPVVVAAEDLPAGAVVTFDSISQRSMPEQFVTSSSVKPDSAGYIVNQRLANPVNAGDVIRWSDFGPQRSELKGDSRMFTLELQPGRAGGGELSKGDHVDVLATLTDPITHQRGAQTLVENVPVMGLTARKAPERTTVQLMVSAEDAQRLLLAEEVGSFTLIIRGNDDVASQAPAPVTLDALLHPPPPPPPPGSDFRCRFPMLTIVPGKPH